MLLLSSKVEFIDEAAEPALAEISLTFSETTIGFWLWRRLVFPLVSPRYKETFLFYFSKAVQEVVDERFGPDVFRVQGTSVSVGSLLVEVAILSVGPGAYLFVKDYKVLRENMLLIADDIKKAGHKFEPLVDQFVHHRWFMRAIARTGRSIRYVPEERSRSRSRISWRYIATGTIVDAMASTVSNAATILILLPGRIWPTFVPYPPRPASISFSLEQFWTSPNWENPTVLLVTAGLGLLYTILGAFVAARGANDAELVHSFFVGCLAVALFLVLAWAGNYLRAPLSSTRFWIDCIECGLFLPSALIGGLMAKLWNEF